MRFKTVVQLFSEANMKTKQRDITICILTLLVTALAVGYFFGSLDKQKTTEPTDLFSLAPRTPDAWLVVERPGVFARLMLSQPEIQALFAARIPAIYLTLIRQQPDLTKVLFSFHKQGVVMYAYSNESIAYRIDKEILSPAFNAYSPERQTEGEITFIYYPAATDRFFGCYQYRDVFVASFSRKLLEGVAARQQLPCIPAAEWRKQTVQPDMQAPVSLLVPAEALNLYVLANDSTEWRIRDTWLGADLFTREGHLCAIGAQPYHAVLDTFYAPMADTLSVRLEEAFPGFRFQTVADVGNEWVYFTVCSD